MFLTVKCPFCQTTLEVDEKELGFRGCCPQCEGHFVITAASGPAAAGGNENMPADMAGAAMDMPIAKPQPQARSATAPTRGGRGNASTLRVPVPGRRQSDTDSAIPIAQPEPMPTQSSGKPAADTDTTEIPVVTPATDAEAVLQEVFDDVDARTDDDEPVAEDPLPIAAVAEHRQSNEHAEDAATEDEEDLVELPVAQPVSDAETADAAEAAETTEGKHDPIREIELYDTTIDLDIDLDFDTDNIDDQTPAGDGAETDPGDNTRRELAKPFDTISPTDQMQVLKPGTMVAGFEIGPLLGSGSMGQVYLANQVSMQRDVALKILPERMLSQDQAAVDNFMNEVRLLAKLDHPNIVTAFEAGNAASIYYLAMTYVNGENLEQRQRREPVIPEVEALGFCLDIARALEHAWNRFSVLHRDIKPANIMIDGMGEVRLMDLGIAKMSSDDEGQPTFVMGTPYYMSPEQATARPNLDWHTDQYSLGATLYHLLSGRVPFPGENSIDIMTKQAYEPLAPPKELNPDISAGTNKLVRKMMAKNPDNRFNDWSEVIAAIEKLIAALKEREQRHRDPRAPKNGAGKPRSRRKRAKGHHKAPASRPAGPRKRPSVAPRRGPGIGVYVGGFTLLILVLYLILAIVNKADGLHPYRLPQGLFPPGLRPQSNRHYQPPRPQPPWRRQ